MRLHDLRLGMRLAWRGARTRTLLTAIGISLAVAVLLVAASIPHARDAVEARSLAREAYPTSVLQGGKVPPATDSTVRVGRRSSEWLGRPINGVLVAADGSKPVLPPGLQRLPQADEVFVSPALAKLLDAPANRLLRDRFAARYAGTIDPEGLKGPAELFWYGALPASTPIDGTRGWRLTAFGDAKAADATMRLFVRLVVLVGAVILLFPIAILVFTAARFGGERRDRRLAAMRLVGAGRSRALWIAGGESLAAATVGLVGGAALFLAARQGAGRIELYDLSLFTGDLTPSPILTVIVVCGVLAVSLAATFGSFRRVAVEPLGVVRRARTAGSRRLWWRVAPGILGFALLAQFIVGSAPKTGNLTQIGIGATLVIASLAALLPWVIEWSVARMRPWSPASQLAIRALQQDPAGAARIAGGVAVAVAGAIALQTLLTIGARDLESERAERLPANVGFVTIDPGSNGEFIVPSRDWLESLPGVQTTSITSSYELRGHGGAADGMVAQLTVGTCADLVAIAQIGRCDERSSMYWLSPPAGVPLAMARPKPGERVKASDWSGADVRWTKLRVPEELPTVRLRGTGQWTSAGLLATRGAVPGLARWQPTNASTAVWLNSSSPMAFERLRTAIEQRYPEGELYRRSNDEDILVTVRRALLAGATILLLLLGSSLLVTGVEQLGERRRSLATLAATGVPSRTLRRSMVLRTLIPTALALALASAVGLSLGAALLALQHEPVAFDLPGMIAVVLLAGGLITAANGALLPALRRAAAPSSMRTE